MASPHLSSVLILCEKRSLFQKKPMIFVTEILYTFRDCGPNRGNGFAGRKKLLLFRGRPSRASLNFDSSFLILCNMGLRNSYQNCVKQRCSIEWYVHIISIYEVPHSISDWNRAYIKNGQHSEGRDILPAPKQECFWCVASTTFSSPCQSILTLYTNCGSDKYFTIFKQSSL